MTTTDLSDADVNAAEENMRAMGVQTEESVAVDYFAFDERYRVTLPDGVSWVEHKALSEGERRQYLNGINRDVTVKKATGDAHMQMRPGDERYSLLRTAITGWSLTRLGSMVVFSKQALDEFLQKAPPKVIDLIDKDVRKVNAWLIEDMSIEDLQRERDNIDEMIAAKEKETAGN